MTLVAYVGNAILTNVNAITNRELYVFSRLLKFIVNSLSYTKSIAPRPEQM